MSPQLDINGHPIGGLTGLCAPSKEVRRAKPDRVVVCWEGGRSQKRREKNKNYKLDARLQANREYEFAPQRKSVRKVRAIGTLTEYLENLPILQMSLET